ncbi:LpqN/LpqT family lipoprotein [Gordonia sp. DT101]|uniref:LpqN/LpqT family lipoprotein n=1 Tax=Gordonia sp. DT101 TaxID=3416545 RepID=UPI003CFA28AE
MSEIGLYERVRLMSVAAARVIDPRTIAGDIRIDASALEWQEDPSGRQLGYLRILVAPESPLASFRDNIFLVLTRFIVDRGVDVNDALDEAFNDARRLSDWTEQQAERFPITDRNEGGTIQAGSYRDDSAGWLFAVTKHVLYQRGNVVYLLQCTGTTASETAERWSSLLRTVKSAYLDD